MDIFTHKDLLEYYYHEVSPEKSHLIAFSLSTDQALSQKFEDIRQSMHQLDKCIRSPRPKSLQTIIDYAASNQSAPVK